MSNILKSNEIFINNGNKFMLRKEVNPVHDKGYKFPSNNRKSHVQNNKSTEAAKEEVSNILADAERKADSIINAAVHEARQIKQRAQQEGFQAGYREGAKKAEQLFFSELQEVQSLKKEIIVERERLYHQFERDLVNLALDIAKRVVYDRLEQDDEVLRYIVESTLQRVQGKAKKKLRINAGDQDRIERLKEAFLSKFKPLEDIEIIGDQHIGTGSCIIETDNGIIDGSVQSRVEEIEMALSGGRHEQQRLD